jgi:hypothetical protein
MRWQPILCSNPISLWRQNFRKPLMLPRLRLPNRYAANKKKFFHFGELRILQMVLDFQPDGLLSCRMSSASFVESPLLALDPLFHCCTPSASIVISRMPLLPSFLFKRCPCLTHMNMSLLHCRDGAAYQSFPGGGQLLPRPDISSPIDDAANQAFTEFLPLH